MLPGRRQKTLLSLCCLLAYNMLLLVYNTIAFPQEGNYPGQQVRPV